MAGVEVENQALLHSAAGLEEQCTVPCTHERIVISPSQAQRSSISRTPLTPYLCVCVLICTLSSTLLGYDVGVIAGAKLKVKEYFHLSDGETEVSG